MEPRDQDVLFRCEKRLTDQLDPGDFLQHLAASGIHHDYSEACKANFSSESPYREELVELLLESLRKHQDGLSQLVRGLLLSEKQDFLAREILEYEIFEENDIKDLLESLDGKLSEVQILKLELLKERKNHENTKRELEGVKSNRNSAVFSDQDSSYCSGVDSCEAETMGYLLKELEEEKRRREEAEIVKRCHEQELHHLAKKNIKLEESQRYFLRHFNSLDDVTAFKDDEWRARLPWKAASVADLCVSDRTPSLPNSSSEGTLTKWRSEDSGWQLLSDYSKCRNSPVDSRGTGVIALAERMSILEAELKEEREKRESSDYEIMKLESENKDLHWELDETRSQLFQVSQLDLTQFDTTCDEYMDDDYDETAQEQRADESHLSMDYHNAVELGRGVSCPALNLVDQRHDHSRLSHARTRRPFSYHGDTDITNVWENRNREHYEMDEYENEIEKKPDAHDTDLGHILRTLKLDVWHLYNELVMSSAELKLLSNRVKRLSANSLR